MPLVGFMSSGEPAEFLLASFRQGLRDRGFVEGKNVSVEYRFAQFRRDRLPEFAADFVRRNAAVIAATGEPWVAAAAKVTTSTIPIIFETGTDPVQNGLVARLNRPGGNVTGINSMIFDLWPKLFNLLTKLRPNVRVVGVLLTSGADRVEEVKQEAQHAVDAIGGMRGTALKRQKIACPCAAIRSSAQLTATLVNGSAAQVVNAGRCRNRRHGHGRRPRRASMIRRRNLTG
jgi:putative ABC transport system substrate-binding protein